MDRSKLENHSPLCEIQKIANVSARRNCRASSTLRKKEQMNLVRTLLIFFLDAATGAPYSNSKLFFRLSFVFFYFRCFFSSLFPQELILFKSLLLRLKIDTILLSQN